MKIALHNGRILVFTEADRWQISEGLLEILGPRKRWIATFRLATVAGWWYDNEDCITYGTTDQLEEL